MIPAGLGWPKQGGQLISSMSLLGTTYCNCRPVSQRISGVSTVTMYSYVTSQQCACAHAAMAQEHSSLYLSKAFVVTLGPYSSAPFSQKRSHLGLHCKVQVCKACKKCFAGRPACLRRHACCSDASVHVCCARVRQCKFGRCCIKGPSSHFRSSPETSIGNF